MRRLLCLLFIVLVMMNVGLAFGQEKEELESEVEERPEPGEPIRIGGLFALSGNAMHIGVPTQNVADMVVDHINKEGGINGRPVKLYMADTESNPAKAVAAFKRLVTKDRVVAVIGPTTTGAGMACMSAIGEAKIPVVGCIGGTPFVEPVEKRYWAFKSPQKTVTAVERIYTFLKKKGWKKVALLTASNKFGQEGEQSLTKIAPKYGIEILGQEAFDVKSVDMSVQLSKLDKLNPDAIICWTVGPAGAKVAKNAKQIKLKAKLFQCHGQPDPIYIKLAGEAANGTYMPSTKLMVADQLPDDDPQKSLLLKFVTEYEKERKYGEVSTHSGYAWDAMQIIAKAMGKAGTTNPQKVRDAIEKTKGYVGVSGVYNLSSKDHCGLDKDSLVMITVENGKWKLVD